jgi:alkylhydroperoxidase/carboxymuconolactone decarboxylase family protein YurZ
MHVFILQPCTLLDCWYSLQQAAEPQSHKERRRLMTQKPSGLYLKLKERHSDFIEAVEALGKSARLAGPLDDKTGHLIQLGAAAAIHSKGSVSSHAARALDSGATIEEIQHAVIVLTSTIGFPTVAAALSWIEEVIENRA